MFFHGLGSLWYRRENRFLQTSHNVKAGAQLLGDSRAALPFLIQ